MKTNYKINNNELIINLNYYNNKNLIITNIRNDINRFIIINNIKFDGKRIIVYINGILNGIFYLTNYYLKKKSNNIITDINSYYEKNNYIELKNN